MKILYVDDERSAHTIFQYATMDYGDFCEVSYHFNYDSAMEYARNNEIDCAFLDISLPGKDGIQLAKDLQQLQPKIEFAFVTGFDEYAREAYKVGGRAYLTKPYSNDELHSVLELMKRLCHPPEVLVEPVRKVTPHISAKTFGFFDFMLDGKPVYFRNAKAKELLAYLVHHMGSSVSSAQVFFALWERQEYTRTTSTYVRRTIRALRNELESVGVDDILVVNRNSISLVQDKITCDAYDLLNGSAKAAALFNDEYMGQYSWGESTIPLLQRAASTLLKD